MGWLQEILTKLWQWIVDGAVALLSAIPVPEWLSEVGDLWASLPDPVLFFMQSLALPEGMAIIGVAYVTRFIIRRLPIVG